MKTNYMKKDLELIIQPKVIDHLGIKMYQKPVDVISEFIANSWDADSEIVDILINSNSIVIKDRGIGMTYDQCQQFFLTVGRDRRKSLGKEVTEEKQRPVLGRKGIGKFAGFGIAKEIIVTSISKSNGELTSFQMDIDKILESDSLNKDVKPIKLINYRGPNEESRASSGTTIELIGIDTSSSLDIDLFRQELSRRFLLSQLYGDFEIFVNNSPLPDSFADDMEYVFPRDFTPSDLEKIPPISKVDENGWAIENFLTYQVKWRIGFFEDTIETEELRGISIFAKGKMAQKPFFFDLVGGISGQHGIEYMTGQVIMDFIDEGNNDLIATERQRINLNTDLGKRIKEWGIEKIKFLSLIWKKNRSDKRLSELEEKLGGFKERLEDLPPYERKTVKSVLLKIATFERLGKQRFHDWCTSILTSWETGRLRELITEISNTKDLDEQKMLEILSEADVLTALNIAETVKTKILTISELKKRVSEGHLENTLRDFIYKNPWIIHPKWESYRKERSVSGLIADIGNKHLKSEIFNGRVDLALASGSNLLLVEFIRPGLPLDEDHLDRINYYVIELTERMPKETGRAILKLESAYVVSDVKKESTIMKKRIEQLEKDNIFVMTWEGLIQQALKQWDEYLKLLKERHPNDKRIQDL